MASVVVTAMEHAWRTLEPLGAPMAVMGGLALAVWDRIRSTRDVDIMMDVPAEAVPALIERMKARGFTIPQPTPISLGPIDLLQFYYDVPGTMINIRVDILLARAAFHRGALARRVAVEPEGDTWPVRVVACEDLILLKLLAGRMIDRVDVSELLAANVANIDMNYLLRWAKELSVLPGLKEAWGDVFPDRPLSA